MKQRATRSRTLWSASGRTTLGKIRKMLRDEPVMEREEIRERLRAAGKLSLYAHGGRRAYFMFHYLEERGEVTLTPTHITAVALLPAPKRKYKPAHRTRGPNIDRQKAAAKRARKVARLAEKRTTLARHGIGNQISALFLAPRILEGIRFHILEGGFVSLHLQIH